MHHCALEDAAIYIFGGAQAHSAASPDSQSPPHCPSHSQNDPSTHSEGQPCSAIIQVASKTDLPTFATPLLPVALSLAMLGESDLSTLNNAVVQTRESNLQIPNTFSQLAHSLSLSPNAPPRTLV